MAKEKKEGTEGEKVEVHDIDETFGNAEDAPKDVTTETEEKVTTEEAPETPEKEEVSEKAEADTTVPKTWKDYDLEDFEGKSDEEIARIVVQDRRESEHGRKVYGEQGEELGALRKYKTDAEAEKAKPKEEKEPDLIDALPEKMSDGEVLDFNAIYEKNPVKAMLKYGGATIKQMIASQLKESLAGKVEGAVGDTIAEQKDSIAYSNFLSKHDDAQTFLPLMQTLDGEKHLGNQDRSYEELFELAKLGPHTQGTVIDPLYNPVYQLMAKHPTLSFKEALAFAKQGAGAEEKAVEKKAEVKKTINKIDSVNTASKGTPKSQGTKELVTIDDEFEI